MLLMQEPELLLLDEPVAGMSPRERELTAELLRTIACGRSMVVIEHDMEFVPMNSYTRSLSFIKARRSLKAIWTRFKAIPVSSKSIWGTDHADRRKAERVLW